MVGWKQFDYDLKFYTEEEKMRQREMDVLNVLFSNTEPMTASEVVSKMQALTQSTVTVALRSLLNSGYV